MTDPMIGRALLTAAVQASWTCERRPQCGRMLDRRKAVSFTLVTASQRRIDMVTCAACYDVHIATIPEQLPQVTVTIVDVLDGRALWARKPRVRA